MASKKSKKKKSSSKSSGKGSSPSMDELMEKYDAPVKSLTRGDKVKGKVIKKEPGRVVIDIGGKSEGIVAEKAYNEAEEFIKDLKEGDEVEAGVIVPETPEGFTILSLRQAMAKRAWDKIEESQEEGDPIKVKGKSVASAGVMVDVFGLEGFIPKSQIGKEASKDLNTLVGKTFEAVVIDTDKENAKLVLSEKEVSEAEELAKAREAIKNLKVGDEFEGEVTSIYDFGCFVKIEAKISKGKKDKEKAPLEGLVHISELSWGKVDNPKEVVSEGDEVKVKLIGKEKGKIAFSIKQTQKDPWEDIDKKYEKDSKVKGEVVKLSDFGAFVELEAGVEGLIHMTKIPPGKAFSEGDRLDVFIEDIDEKERKISLRPVLTQKPVGYK